MKQQFEHTNTPHLFRSSQSGVYYMRASFHGKQVTKSLGTTDFKTAKGMLIGTLAATENAVRFAAVPKAMLTVGDALDALVANKFSLVKRTDPVKPRTLENYHERLRVLLKTWPGLRDLPLAQLTPALCGAWAEQARQQIAAQSFNQTLAVFHNALQLAVQSKCIAENPTDVVQNSRLKDKSSIPKMPTRDEFNSILRVLDCSVHAYARDVADLVRLRAYSGLRPAEASALRWENVNFNSGYILVEWQKARYSNERVTPKNGKHRYVTLNAALRAHLLDMFNRAGHKQPFDRVTRVESCRASLIHACKVVGCPVIRQHDLRHIFATICVESGVDWGTLAGWMGHQDGGILAAKTYAHYRQDHAERMAARVEFVEREPDNVTSIEPPQPLTAVV